jgi:hypothetical protein
LLPRLGNGELNDSFTYMFQSAFMLLKNLFIYDALLNPGAPFNNPPLFMAAVALFKALILSAAVMITLREKENDFIPFAVWITASMLLSPNGSSYSLVLLLIPFLQLGANAQIRLSKKRLLPSALVVLFLLVVLPVYRFSSWPLLMRFPRLYLFVVFFGLLLLQSTRVFNYKLVLALFAVFFLPGLLKPAPPKDSSVYLLAKEEHLLIVGYGVEQNKLQYSWFDGTGLHNTETMYMVKEATAGDLYIRDNQLWYHGRKITASADHKMSPLLIDGQYIVYLSDKNRGIGFYTLRRLTLAQALQDAAAWPVSAQ